LITIDRDVLNQLLKQSEKSGLAVLKPSFVNEIIEAIKYPGKIPIDTSLKTIPREIAKEIISYIEKREFEESPEWSRRLVAHEYAEDLFNQASKGKKGEDFYLCLQQIVKLFDDKSWSTYFQDPNIRLSDKHKILNIACEEKIVLSLIYKLLDINQTELIPGIMDEYHKMLTGSSIVLSVEVTTAIPIDPKFGKQIAKYLDRMFNKKVFPTFLTDPKILGGIVIRADDTVLDYSIRNKLSALRKEMMET
jgi:F-type H+-transporting ATPase subunit delta